MRLKLAILVIITTHSLHAMEGYNNLLQMLNKYRSNGLFTDCHIKSNSGTKFPCHLPVIARYNDTWDLLSKDTAFAIFNHKKAIQLPYSDETIKIIIDKLYSLEANTIQNPITFNTFFELQAYSNFFDSNMIDELKNIEVLIDKNDDLKLAIEMAIDHKNHLLLNNVFKFYNDNYEIIDIGTQSNIDEIIAHNAENIFVQQGLRKYLNAKFIKNIKNKYDPWFQQHISTISIIDKIPQLDKISPEDLSFLILNSEDINKRLLEDKINRLKNLANYIKPQSAEELAAITLALSQVDFQNSFNIAFKISQEAGSYTFDDNTIKASWSASSSNWNSAAKAAQRAQNSLFENLGIFILSGKNFQVLNNNEINHAVSMIKSALANMELSNAKKASYAWSLAEIYVNLIDISHLQIEAYEDYLNSIRENDYIKLSPEQIKRIIAKKTWAMRDLRSNLYIRYLRKIIAL